MYSKTENTEKMVDDKESMNGYVSIDEWVEKLYNWEEENALNLEYPESLLDHYVFPKNKNDLKNLKKLHICGYVDSRRIPIALKNGIPKEIGELSNLRQLVIAVSDIVTIPKEIGNLINLYHLEIDSCSELVCLPKEIFNLNYLTSFSIRMTKINKFPKEIGSFPHLLELTLCENGIIKLPDEITNLKSLRILNIDLNPNLLFTKKQEEWLNELEEQGCDISINAYLEDASSKKLEIILDQDDIPW